MTTGFHFFQENQFFSFPKLQLPTPICVHRDFNTLDVTASFSHPSASVTLEQGHTTVATRMSHSRKLFYLILKKKVGSTCGRTSNQPKPWFLAGTFGHNPEQKNFVFRKQKKWFTTVTFSGCNRVLPYSNGWPVSRCCCGRTTPRLWRR